LLNTIYPFREEKLRDFLLYLKEIDLWGEMGEKAVDDDLGAELIQEHYKLQKQLQRAKSQLENLAPKMDKLKGEQRKVLTSKEVRSLIYKKNNLQAKLSSQEANIKTLKRRVEWYTQFAPDHPYFEKYSKQYEVEKIPYEQTQAELRQTEKAYRLKVENYDSQTKALVEKSEKATQLISLTEEKLKKLPAVSKNGEVSPSAAVQWLVLKYETELRDLNQKELLKQILERFDREPQRFPMWLRYMVIHFSGMRYQSAHGSWADAKDLLESLEIEALTQENRSIPQDKLETEIAQALSTLQDQRSSDTDSKKTAQIDRQIRLLKNEFTRQRVLLEIQIEAALQEVRGLSETQVLDRLRGMKDQFPDWVWKEITSRTGLRLEARDENWESLSEEETRQRWAWENRRWREIMDAWERKDITAWRKQHERTLSLIVSRAVCNEIAEHIQHLRGLIPAAGLTSKPVWYLNSQKKNPGKSYFMRPRSSSELKPGSSILFLGWVPRQPNAWQIAHPLSGVDILPNSAKPAQVKRRGIVEGKGDTWKYRVEGDRFTRTSQPLITKIVNPPKVKKVKGPVIKEWLRWTHEATVIDVVEMADGDYVMTFETGKIGVNLRPLSHILNRWDIFVGFIPGEISDETRLASMLDRSKLLPAGLPQAAAEAQPTIAFGLSTQEEAMDVRQEEREQEQAIDSGMETVQRWQSLTPREKQIVALICQGYSTRQAARLLDTSASNIRSHLSNAMGKFGVHRRGVLSSKLADWDFSVLELE
jgi:DNA-binding CsgD family transcriptional regulator